MWKSLSWMMCPIYISSVSQGWPCCPGNPQGLLQAIAFRSTNEAGRGLRRTSQDTFQRTLTGTQDRQAPKVASSILCSNSEGLGIAPLDCRGMGRNVGFSFGKVLCLQLLLHSKPICQAKVFSYCSPGKASPLCPALEFPRGTQWEIWC